jgi:HK97 family phage portal protein
VSILASLFAPPVKASAPRPDDSFWYRAAGPESSTGVRVSADTAMRASAVWGCVRLISETIASLPLSIYSRTADGGRREATGHPIYTLLHYRPNRLQTSTEFLQMLTAHALLRGNGYGRIVPGPRGPVDEIVPLHPDWVTPEELVGGGVRYRVSRPGVPTEVLNDEDVLHLRGIASAGVVGLSVIEHARETVGLALATEGYGARLFSQNARPGGVLTHPSKLNQETADRIRASWQQAHAGLGNAHAVAVLEEGMKFEPVGMTNEDSQFIATREFQAEEIARWFGVPPHMIGLTSKSTCLPGDVLVYTENGPKPIKDVQAGDRVWSLGDDGFVLSSVFRQEQTGYDKILTIRTTARTLRANAAHRVLVRRKHPNPQPGIGGYRKVEWRNEWVTAGELVAGDILVAARELPAGTGRVAPSGRALTVEFMEVMGLLLGDGGVTRANKQRTPTGLEFARHRDAPYMDHYREAIRREFVCLAEDRQTPRPVKLQEYERATKVSSVLAGREMASLGCCGNAHTKRVPAWVFGLAPDLQLGLLRGYLDSDGALNTRGWITYSSVNKALLEDIRHLCIAVGVPVGNVAEYRTKGSGLVAGRPINRAWTMYQLYLCDQVANRLIGSHHPRDAARLETAPAPKRKGRNHAEYQGRGGSAEARPGTHFDIPGASLQVIQSIECSSVAEPVYDLGVDGTHSFIANGLVVHNSWGSGIEAQSINFLTYTLLPWLRRWEQTIARDLISADGYYFAKFNVNGLLRGDAASRSAYYSIGRQWGYLSANDIRGLEDLNPIGPAGDRYLEPMNMAQAGEDRTPVAAPPRQPPGARAHHALLVQDAAHRIIRREVAALTKAAQRTASDASAWGAAVAEFYADHTAYVSTSLRVPLADAERYVAEQQASLENRGVAAMSDWETCRVADLVALAMGEE